MLKKILFVFLLLVIGFVIFVATRPSEFRVARSTTIAVPASSLFPHLNDLRQWEAWSPWAKLDPNAKNTFEGPASGTNAVFAWAGNKEIGEGKMTIIESRANEFVRYRLEFKKPMEGISESAFTLKPEGNGTHVTWSMNGTNNFVAKAICLFMDMDKMLGGEFEKGLAAMKSVAEGAARR